MKKRIITISREFGSGGHSIRKIVAETLGIGFYNQELLEKIAEETGFSKEFIEEVAPLKGIEVLPYSDEKQKIYQEIERDYDSGSTRMTARPQDVNQASSVSYSFFVDHPQFSPERLVHIYDIAGEVFTNNSENEVQKQYEYCQGIVLIIDPFAIPSVRYEYEDLLEPEDIAEIGRASCRERV